jgi:hypothetical protein
MQNKSYSHEDCVTGASVFNIGEKELCTCQCHQVEAQRINDALSSGKTKQQLIDEWYKERGGIGSKSHPSLRKVLDKLHPKVVRCQTI